jgi:DNA invertase Pin-like site-specific DNA recombinase
LFCRVSTKEQTSCESTSLPLQEARLREAAELLNSDARLVIHKISGSAYQRIPPQLVEVGEMTSSGDTIMVWRVDRLSRNIVDYLSWLEGFE